MAPFPGRPPLIGTRRSIGSEGRTEIVDGIRGACTPAMLSDRWKPGQAETRASIVGSTRYAFTIDNPKNKEFVALWQKEHGT